MHKPYRVGLQTEQKNIFCEDKEIFTKVHIAENYQQSKIKN